MGTLSLDATRLDRADPTPLWYQLKELLLHSIEEDLNPGDLLPPERVLASQLSLSTITVRRALDELSKEGRLRREQGRGTYVLPPRFEEGPNKLTGFTEEMSAFGLKTSSRILEIKVLKGPSWIISKLGLVQGSRIVRLQRLRFAGEQPMALQIAHLPVGLVPGFSVEELGTRSLYSYLAKKYSLTPTSAQEIHFADLLTAEEARRLGVPQGSPGLRAERLTLGLSLKQNKVLPMEYVRSVMRGDRYRVHLELKRLT